MRDMVGLGVIPALLLATGFAAGEKYVLAAVCAGVCSWFAYKANERRKELMAR